MKRVARDLNPLPVMKIRTVVGHVQTVHRCRVFGDGGHELREDKIGCFPSTKGRGTASVTFVSGARALVEGAARMRITAPPLSSTSARERCCPRTRIDRLLPRCYPGTRKVVAATGFEPATPWAQGERTHATRGSGRPLPLVFLRKFPTWGNCRKPRAATDCQPRPS